MLPASTAELLRKRKPSAHSEWIFMQPLKPGQPVDPGAAYRRLKQLLEEAGLPDISFHALRHTFATHALSSGVDAKTLAGILGHTNAAFTLNTYTHVTDAMRQSAADKIDRGIAKCEPAAGASAAGEGVPAPGDGTRRRPASEPYKGKIRKAGTGCDTETNFRPLFGGKRPFDYWTK